LVGCYHPITRGVVGNEIGGAMAKKKTRKMRKMRCPRCKCTKWKKIPNGVECEVCNWIKEVGACHK